jgi:hypothetical protein
MTDRETHEMIKLIGAALIGAFVSLVTILISNWQANRGLKIEIQERQKDRVTRFTEKLSEKVIDSHVTIYQSLIHFKECMYFQNDYLTGDWFWGLEQPKDLVNMNEMFKRLGDIIRVNEIWLHPDCAGQLKKLRWELQQGRETELLTGDNEDEETKNKLFPIYNKVIEEIDTSLKIIRTSIGIDSFDSLFRATKK